MADRRSGTDAEREHDALLFFLNRVRDGVASTCEGLPEETLRAPGVPSGTNLLGLVQHLTAMEIHWFRVVFRGEDVAVDESMSVPAEANAEGVLAAYRVACVESDRVVESTADLSMLAKASNPGETQSVSLRRIIAHMIEETARHSGHADILREQIDGATGL